MKRILILLIVSLLIMAGLFYILSLRETSANVCFKDRCFLVELAKTPEEIRKGLMFRESLEPDKGMLFIFEEESEHSFWMKDTKIPLDIIWINSNKEVIFIEKGVQPCQGECEVFSPEVVARYVLELNAGTTDSLGVGLGDKLSF